MDEPSGNQVIDGGENHIVRRAKYVFVEDCEHVVVAHSTDVKMTRCSDGVVEESRVELRGANHVAMAPGAETLT